MLSANITLPSISSTMIGNCKGIMLCNHPVYQKGNNNQIQQTQMTQNNTKSSFICGIVPKPWGSNNKGLPALDEENNNNYYDEEQYQLKKQRSKQILKRIKNKKGFLSKHKQWLHNLQKEKEELKLIDVKDKSDKEEKKRKFMEREANKRAWVYDARRNDDDEEVEDYCHVIEDEEEDEQKFYHVFENDAEIDDNWIEESTKEIANQSNSLKQTLELKNTQSEIQKTGTSTINKPVWAYTEEKAQEVEEYLNGKEESDLLSFVENLNFEQYSNDLEVKVLMKQLNERIHHLEKENYNDVVQLEHIIKREKEETIPQGKNKFNLLADSTVYNEEMHEINKKDRLSIKEEILNSEMAKIHSHKSLECLVEKSKDKMIGEISIHPPRMITHSEDNGARLALKSSIEKLPYKNRNPSV